MERRARRWWWVRFGQEEAEVMGTDKALEDMLLGDRIKNVTKTITVVRKGKYTNITGYKLTDGSCHNA